MDKPAGPTSHDVVHRVRRIFRLRSVGHTGTLDPFATGLLVLLLGRGTRVARFLDAAEKTYLATARLGWATDTDDLTGQPLGEPGAVGELDPESVRQALAGMVGSQLQRPPAFSAKHVGGERSHRLARRGAAVELAPVLVTVHRLDPVRFEGPLVTFRATVSTGTYIRALVRDLGERLGVGGHLTALRREAIGPLRVEDAVALDALTGDTPLIPLRRLLGHLPAVELDEAARIDVLHGRPVPAGGGIRSGGGAGPG